MRLIQHLKAIFDIRIARVNTDISRIGNTYGMAGDFHLLMDQQPTTDQF